jgi:catechol 2,3-dioxygenase-like lactoylglutathione lyase family enzyme
LQNVVQLHHLYLSIGASLIPRRIDHLVVAVRDLDRAAALYRRLGFQVGALNRHPWGTENRLVQFPGSFIELITIGEGAEVPGHRLREFSFGAFVRDYLACREGIAMLALDTTDAQADAAAFARARIGDFEPFSFERRGRRPDGAEAHVAFTLAFARDDAAPDVGYFVCQHHHPDNFWTEAFQRHPNGAKVLTAVVLAAPEPKRHDAFLGAFTGAERTSPSGHDLSYGLDHARLDVMTPDAAAEVYTSIEADPGQAGLVGFAVSVADIDRQAQTLVASSIPFQRVGSRLIVPPSAAFGAAVAFEPPLEAR